MCNGSVIHCDLEISSGFQVTASDQEILNEIYFWADGVLGSLIAVVGFIMNGLAIYILSTKDEMRHMTTEILCRLLVTENSYLLLKLTKILYYD